MSKKRDSSPSISLKEVNKVKEDIEQADEACGFPKSVFFIISNEFCERFSYYGMKTVLTLYFINVLALSDDDSVTAYHAFSMLCYFTPLFGAILADSVLGRYKTILYISFLYSIGSLTLSFASWIEKSWLTVLGLLMIAVGTGGIKPCVSAFGGDQFGPGQEKQLQWFFSLFYLSINSGSLISTFVTPVFRQQIDCSARGDCFPLAFGVPAIIMVTALFLFWLGRSHYKRIPPAKGNVILETFKCITYAGWKKIHNTFTCGGVRKNHWIDLAEDKFDRSLINDVKCLTEILYLYIPIPIFWALFDQQGSRWTLQANRMNGQFFGTSWYIQPDQIQVVNPVLIVIMIPLFEYVIYPALALINVCKKPLQRMTYGGILAAVSFVVAGLLHQVIESKQPLQPLNNQFSISLINGNYDCSNNTFQVHLQGDLYNKTIPDFVQTERWILDGNFTDGEVQVTFSGADDPLCKVNNLTISVNKTASVLLYLDSLGNVVRIAPRLFKYQQPEGQVSAILGIIDRHCGNNSSQLTCPPAPVDAKYLQIKSDSNVDNQLLYDTSVVSVDNSTSSIIHLKATSSVSIASDQLAIHEKLFTFTPGELDVLIVNCCQVTKVQLIPGHNVSMLLQAGEILFSVSGLEFSYSNSPRNLRSVVTAAWLLTNAFGNLIVILIAHSSLFSKQSQEFYFFAGLMLIDIVLFAWMAYRYKSSKMINAETSSETTSTEDLEVRK